MVYKSQQSGFLRQSALSGQLCILLLERLAGPLPGWPVHYSLAVSRNGGGAPWGHGVSEEVETLLYKTSLAVFGTTQFIKSFHIHLVFTML